MSNRFLALSLFHPSVEVLFPEFGSLAEGVFYFLFTAGKEYRQMTFLFILASKTASFECFYSCISMYGFFKVKVDIYLCTNICQRVGTDWK